MEINPAWRRRLVLLAGLVAGCAEAARGQPAGEAAASPSVRATEILGRFEVRGDLPFAERGGRKLALDLFLPDREGPHPLVLVIHGGGWSLGTRKLGEARPLAESLAKRGIAAASIDYRLAPAHPHPAQIEDCRRALQWLRAHAAEHRLDAGKVAALGASAGGHLASLLALQDDAAARDAEDPVARQSTRIRCCVAVVTPFDLRPDPEHPPTALQVRTVARFLGAVRGDDPEALEALIPKARDASPVTWVGAGDPPFLIVSGMEDPIVPPWQARRMASALGAAKIEHEVIEIQGGGHGEWMGRVWEADPVTPEDYWPRTVRFLRRHLEAPPVVR